MEEKEKTAEELALEFREMEAAQKDKTADKTEEKEEEAEDVEDKRETEKEEVEENEEEEDELFEDIFEEVKAPKEKAKAAEKEDDVEEDDDLSEEDKKLIDARVGQKVKEETDKIRQEVMDEKQRNDAWDSYVKENPHVAKYADKIKPYMHKVYNTLVKDGINGIKISEGKAMDAIVGMILGRGMLKIGARMSKEAGDKAAKGSQSASTTRKEVAKNKTGIPDVKDMPTKDFNALVNKIIDGE